MNCKYCTGSYLKGVCLIIEILLKLFKLSMKLVGSITKTTKARFVYFNYVIKFISKIPLSNEEMNRI